MPKVKPEALPAPPPKLAIEDIAEKEEAQEEAKEEDEEEEDEEKEDEDAGMEPPAASSSSTSPVQELLAKLRSLSKEDLRKVKKTIKKF